MSAEDFDDDEYVARLLKQDALSASKNGFQPTRMRTEISRPNTSFLRHIIRQTDSHNAALRAKETKDSRARLRQLDAAQGVHEDRVVERRNVPRSANVRGEATRRERRAPDRADSDEERNRRSHKRYRHDDEAQGTRSRRDRWRDEDRGQQYRGSADDGGHHMHRSHRHQQREYRFEQSADEANSRRYNEHASRRSKRHRSISRSRSRTRSRRSRSPARKHRSTVKEACNEQSRPPTDEDDSDPLEAITGPLPPPKPAAVRTRGRGTHRSNLEGIETRFSTAYDPAMDVDHVLDDDDGWSDAVEAFRDRQRWKQQGAERLKAAGFSEAQVHKWESGGDMNEEDVRWNAQGQAREWDRGKTVDADGDVALKATWTGR
ncbi:hypothetical protein BU23DRAFT_543521 [Bimuria novae-zelandiae CBS 107.79]|uniref:Pre-mRNA-splicing factor 38B n=1 Tax=Bimuria novae-zelandiae CBS 107.79 TaxID=1447943 RepID=A0A6A5UR99_9PLEO|nr:hypothetical protein BU23DRAFT_543521 [Bimuria novae-zelandiae CBS 107.79]